jgi:hypothetical protein
MIELKIDTTDFQIAGLNISMMHDSLGSFFKSNFEAVINLIDNPKFLEYNFKNGVPLNLKKLNIPRLSLLFQEKDNIFNKDSNRTFTHYTLSRIILNRSKDKGMFEISYIAGRLMGKGLIIFIKKENGAWKIEKCKTIWIS